MNDLLRFVTRLIGLLIFSAAVQAQENRPGIETHANPAPVEWRLYKVSAAGASFTMPKVPVRNDLDFRCSEKRASIYHAYAKQAVYEFRVYVKKPEVRGFCPSKEGFSSALRARFDEIRTGYEPPPVSEVDSEVNGRRVKIFRWDTPRDQATRWVFLDDAATHWVELAVNYRPDVKPEIDKFLNSLSSNTSSGIEIEMGAPSIIGDSDAPERPESLPGKKAGKESMLTLNRPMTPYPRAARANGIEGTVILNVAFLANGGIGEISVVRGLSHGLTEEAIATARRLVFLPARENGVPVNTVIRFEHKFDMR